MRPGSSNIAQEQCAKVFDGKVHSFWSEKKSKNVKIILICIFFFPKIVCYKFISPKQLTRHHIFKFLNFYNSESPRLWLHEWICIMIVSLSYFACLVKQCLFKRNYRCWNIYCTPFGPCMTSRVPRTKSLLDGALFWRLWRYPGHWWQYWRDFWILCM